MKENENLFDLSEQVVLAKKNKRKSLEQKQKKVMAQAFQYAKKIDDENLQLEHITENVVSSNTSINETTYDDENSGKTDHPKKTSEETNFLSNGTRNVINDLTNYDTNEEEVLISKLPEDDIFDLNKKVKILDIVDRSYYIKDSSFKLLSKYAKKKGMSRNSFIVRLIGIGLSKELSNIKVSYTIAKAKKASLVLRIPLQYDQELENYKDKLIKESRGEVKFTKSEILDLLIENLLRNFY